MAFSEPKTFSDFKIGDLAIFDKEFTVAEFKDFEKLSGDSNPLHSDVSYAESTEFGALVVPVHMVIAPFSRVAGMIFPGKPSLYLSHEVKAIRPVFFGEKLTYSAKIVSINSSFRTLTIRILACRNVEVVVDANIVVKSLSDTWVEECDDRHYRISKQRCLITGATGEIGSALAQRMAAKGIDLILQHRGGIDKRAQLESRLLEVTGEGQKVEFISTDLLDLAGVDQLCQFLQDSGGVDYVVHLASPGVRSKIGDLVTVNYTSFEKIANATIQGMLVRQKGAIVSIGSVATERYIPGWQHYAAAKAMANQYASSLDRNYSAFGVRGLTVMLGLVATNFSRSENIIAPAMLPEEAADSICRLVLDAKIGQSVIVDIDHETNGRVGFYSKYNKTSYDSGEDMSPEIEKDPSGSRIVPRPPTPNDNEILTGVHHFLKNILKLHTDFDLAGGGLGITPGWDSLRHIEVILGLEKSYNCNFSSKDIEKLTTVDTIVQFIGNLANGR